MTQFFLGEKGRIYITFVLQGTGYFRKDTRETEKRNFLSIVYVHALFFN